MNNLFVMHTQSNLVFACGIVQEYYYTAKNHLVLHAEFKLKEDLLKNLEKVFDSVKVVQWEFNNYANTRNEFTRVVHIYKLIKNIEDYFGEDFDNVFITQASYWDTLFLSKINAGKVIHIEENSYYSSSNEPIKLNILHAMVKNFREIYKRILFGKNKWNKQELINNMFDAYYVLYPYAVREEIRNKNKPLLEIGRQAFLNGIDSLYSNIDLDVTGYNHIVFFADLLERYTNVAVIKEIIRETAKICEKNKLHFMIKYHPREFDKLDLRGNIIDEIPSIIPAEKIIYNLKDRKAIIIGNLTSSVLMAPKIGLDAVSVMNICGEKNIPVQQTYQKLGIKVPTNIDEYKNIIKKFACTCEK